MAEALLDYEAAATRLGCSVRYLKDLVYTRQVGCVKVGRLVKFRDADLNTYIESRAIAPRRAAV